MAAKSKISLDGEIDPQAKFHKIIDEYFGKGDLEKDLASLTPEKRLTVMGKFAEFRWGKKQANAEDSNAEVNSTSELLQAAYREIEEVKKQS